MSALELDLLAKVLPSLRQRANVIEGPGDDCAAVLFGRGEKLLLLASDQLISDVHYSSSQTTPEMAGAKLLKRNLSDIAAMGGEPLWALVNLAVRGMEQTELERFFAGIEETARLYGVSVIGGDFASLPSGEGSLLTASLTIAGEVAREHMALRRNARVGELLCVTGELGNSFQSGHHLSFTPRLREGRFLAGEYSRCMMDVSDGLVVDLGRMARASNVAFKLDTKRLPQRSGATTAMALGDGEDYELLFTLPKEKQPLLWKMWPREFAPITVIGEVIEGDGAVWNQNQQDLLETEHIGYVH